MLTQGQVRRELQQFARQHGLAGRLVTQIVEDISHVYIETAHRTSAALDATAGYDQAEVDRLREDFLEQVAHLRERYNEQSNAVLAALDSGIRALPPPSPSLADWLERLDRAVLGEPDSALYQAVDSVTLGLFRKKEKGR